MDIDRGRMTDDMDYISHINILPENVLKIYLEMCVQFV